MTAMIRDELTAARRSSLILIAVALFSCTDSANEPLNATSGGAAGATSATGGLPAGTGGQPGVGGTVTVPTAGGSTNAPASVGASQGGGAVVASGGAAPAGGAPNSPSSGGSMAAAGSNSGGGVAASGGAAGAASGGSAGEKAAQGGAVGMAGGAATFQSDPGTDGDGTFEQAGPYKRSPEMQGPINGAPKGNLSESRIFPSPAVYAGWTFEYWVYVPSQYEAGKPAALAIMQDGLSQYENDLKMTTLFDNLIHAGEMPVTIGLFVRSGVEGGSRMRVENYDVVSDRYGKMLIEEMIPTVLADYDIVEDPNGWSIGGHSSGGAAAFIAAWFWPDAFRKVFTNCGSFVDIRGANVLPMLVREAPPKPLRVGLRSGTKDLSDKRGSWLEGNRMLANELKAKGYHHRFVHGTNGHNMAHAAHDIADELRWLWRGYKLPHYP